MNWCPVSTGGATCRQKRAVARPPQKQKRKLAMPTSLREASAACMRDFSSACVNMDERPAV